MRHSLASRDSAKFEDFGKKTANKRKAVCDAVAIEIILSMTLPVTKSTVVSPP